MEPKEKTAEVWTEKDSAILMANKALDIPFADPDSDLSTVSRQLLRALEREKYTAQETDQLREALKELIPIAESDRGFYVSDDECGLTEMEFKLWKIAIENARKLIQPNDSTQ